MRIEFLNVWSGKIGEPLFRHLKTAAKRTDIFCFQEADGCFPGRADEILLKNFRRFTGFKYVDKDDIFPQATYVRNELEVVDEHTLFEDVPEIGLGLISVIKTPTGRLNLLNFHGKSRPGNKLDTDLRWVQSNGIIQHFRETTGAVVIGGDFNLDLNTGCVNVFPENGYGHLIKEFGIRATRNEIIWKIYPKTPQMFSDYVFVRGAEVNSFRVPKMIVSDHQMMVLRTRE